MDDIQKAKDSLPSQFKKPMITWILLSILGIGAILAGVTSIFTFAPLILISVGLIILGVSIAGASVSLFGPKGALNTNAIGNEIARLEASLANGSSKDRARDIDQLVTWYTRQGDTQKAEMWSKELLKLVDSQ